MKILETVNNAPCSKTLTIEVGVEEIQQEIDSVYKELGTHALVPGFRPGHAPLHLLKLRFGKAVKNEAQEKVTEKACKDALEELKLQVIGEPKVTPAEKDESEKEQEFGTVPITFKMEFEYIAPFEVETYKELELDVPHVDVTDKQVDALLESYRQQLAILVPAPEDKTIGKEDIVTLDVKATCEGEPFPEASHEGYMLEIGRTQHLPGFEEALTGLSVGGEKTIDLEIPEHYQIEKYRGKQARFETKVRQINRRQLPKIDDEFAKDLGQFDSLEQLRSNVREGLQREAEQRRKEATKVKARDLLVQANPIPVPERMVEAEFRYINAVQNMELARLGTSFDALGDKKEEVLSENRERAEQRVRAMLLLEKIAEKESLKLGEAEFMDFLEGVAAAQGADPDRFVSQMQKKGLSEYYQRQALENKVLDFLLEHAKVTEVVPSAAKEKPKAPKKTAKKTAKKKTEKKPEKK